MKKIFFHNEAIIKRGHPVNFFFVVVKGNANILNSKGNSTLKVLKQGEVYGVLDTLKEKKWRSTVVSDNKSEILIISKDTLVKKIFSSKDYTKLTLNLLKMAG